MSSREKVLKVIQKRQLVSVSNNTRWRQFVAALAELPPQFRVKWLFADEPLSWGALFSPVSGYLEQGGLGPIPFREIEWIEIDPIQHQHRGVLVSDVELDHSEKIDSILATCRLTFSRNGGIYRIFGYQ